MSGPSNISKLLELICELRDKTPEELEQIRQGIDNFIQETGLPLNNPVQKSNDTDDTIQKQDDQ